METIFDHNLTPDEIEELSYLNSWLDIRHGLSFPDPLTETGYRETITPEGALLDLGLLFQHRGDMIKRDLYYSQVPIMAEQYKLGFDHVPISIP